MMDVDMDPPTSGVKRTSLTFRTSSERSAKRAKHDLPDYQLDVLKAQMYKRSLPYRSNFNDAANDPELMNTIQSTILLGLTTALSTTDAKATTLAPLTISQAESFCHGFNPQEHKEWNDAMWKGIIDGDWADLMAHRTYYTHWKVGWLFDDSHSET
jgi:hypothetical protein